MSGVWVPEAVVLLVVFVGCPLWLGLTLILGLRKGVPSKGRRGFLWVGTAVVLTWFGALVAWIVEIRPWQSGIVAHGMSPEGREFCVVQTFQDFFEPYRVSFYIRDADEVWHWHYLAHQDNAWRSTAVEFTRETIRVRHDGVLQKEIPLKTANLSPVPVKGGEENNYCRPASFTATDVAAFQEGNFH